MKGQDGYWRRWEDGCDLREGWGRTAVFGAGTVGSRVSVVRWLCWGLDKILKQGGEWGRDQIHFCLFPWGHNAVNTGEETLRKKEAKKLSHRLHILVLWRSGRSVRTGIALGKLRPLKRLFWILDDAIFPNSIFQPQNCPLGTLSYLKFPQLEWKWVKNIFIVSFTLKFKCSCLMNHRLLISKRKH